MIRLIAADLDNTLLNKESKVDPETIRLLERAAEKGVKVAVATGRSFASAKAIAEQLDQPSPAICYNGAAVIDTKTGEPYFMDCLDRDLVEDILSFARENDLYVQMYDKDEIVVERLRPDRHRTRTWITPDTGRWGTSGKPDTSIRLRSCWQRNPSGSRGSSPGWKLCTAAGPISPSRKATWWK